MAGREVGEVVALQYTLCGSRWKRRRGGHGRVARAVVGNRDAHADLELALQLADALTKARNR